MGKKKLLRMIFGDKNPAKLIVFSYIIAIILGAFLLTLPLAQAQGKWTNPIDALFVITSAICVTGLTPVVTAAYWSLFGQIVIIIWIQIGGIGIMTAAALVGLAIGKKFSMQNRVEFAEEKNAISRNGIVNLMIYVLKATAVIELFGALLLSIQFIPQFGILKGIYFSIFHSISAFCNAGFDIIGANSISPYIGNELISYTIAILIVLGGFGYGVFSELQRKKSIKKLSLHSRLVLAFTLAIVVIPTILILIFEYNNPNTIGNLSFFDKVTASMFQAVTPRTAGYFSISQDNITNPTYIVSIILMFIGGSPQGTAGGLKTTTVLVVFIGALANIDGREDISIGKRRIDREIVRKAWTIVFITLLWTIIAFFLLTITEKGINMSDLFYEVVSAICTVGLTRSVTPMLSEFGKILIAFTMLFGKVGGLSMIYAFTKKKSLKLYKEAKEDIMVG